jgi:hypothetical protein
MTRKLLGIGVFYLGCRRLLGHMLAYVLLRTGMILPTIRTVLFDC